MKQRALYTVALLAFLLAGCAGLTPPKSNAERLAYVNSQFTATVKAATTLYQQDVITKQQAEALTPIIDRGNQAIDAGWAALAQDRPRDVLGYIEVANQALLEISQRVKSHE